MSADDPAARAALLRWRLALGPAAEKTAPAFALAALADAAPDLGFGAKEGDAPEQGPALHRLGELDKALSFVYDDKRPTLSASRPYLPSWLAAVREFFRGDVVAMVQRDAIEKKGLTQLLFEPETLPLLERNVELVATLVSAKGLVPDRAREIARAIVRDVVDDVRKKLETELRSAVLGALRRDPSRAAHAPPDVDWGRTIRKNLRGWDVARRRLVPEKLYFARHKRRRHAHDVIVLVDQSGSMADSVVYASIMASIFASIDALRTKLVFFDTEVVDATPLLADPVDVIFGAQLGGGTDIQRAIAYVQAELIERPERTLLLLVSDLEEGGKRDLLVQRVRQLVESRVTVVALLALSDQGRPSYDHEMARAFAELGVPAFACSPSRLPEVLGQALAGRSPRPPEDA